jgi:hypothetical protein
MSTRFIISAAVILIILLILYRTAAVEAFTNLPQPDLCSDLNETDCKRAAGCSYCSATGLCLNENKMPSCTTAYLVKDIVSGFANPEPGPNPSNMDSYVHATA